MEASTPRTGVFFRALGIVVIGRNEGERLVRCLQSVRRDAVPVVYVDSGSSDGSIAAALGAGADVIQLDPSVPFTAARARNVGCRALVDRHPQVDAVQFVDGDCEVVAGWLEQAIMFLAARTDVVAVCGRTRERFPERSIYNRLCDVEWDTPVGEARACGGNAVIRSEAFFEVGGFRDDLIAGEEPELCVRLRRRGGRIWRLDAEMVLHDAAMSRFGQWWKRAVRGGYAFAQGAHLHGSSPERHWVRESRSAWVWGGLIPLLIVCAVIALGPRALWAFAVYPLQVLRLFNAERGPRGQRWARAFFLVVGKFAEVTGQAKFMAHRWTQTRGRIIEYK